MANDELKKKIIDMLQSAKRCIGQDCNTCKYKKESANYIGVSCMTLRIADELILNGIGDVWDISEKAEKAIISLTKQYKEAEHCIEQEQAIFKKTYMDFFNKLYLDNDFRKKFDSVTLGCKIGMFEDMLDGIRKELAEEENA